MAAKANAKFDNVVAYNVVKLDVKLSEKFTIEIVDQPDPVDWYAMADEVLAITQEGNLAQVEATGVGATKIRLYNSAEQKVLEIAIEVFEAMPDPAVDLGLKAGDPEPKRNKNR